MRSGLPSLEGKIAVVTGAGHGIGEGIARLFAQQGATVVVSDKKVAWARAVAQSIEEDGGDAIAMKCDVGIKKDIDSLVRESVKRFKTIDILVNNAFFWNWKRFEEQTWNDLCAFANVNFVGTYYLTQKVAMHMRKKGIHGSIICITSVHDHLVRRTHPPYSMSKAAIRMLVEEVAVEYGPCLIRANAIAPGHIENDPEKVKHSERADNPYVLLGGKSGLPEDIARVAVLLASPETTGFVSGATWKVDGAESLYNEQVDRMKPGGE